MIFTIYAFKCAESRKVDIGTRGWVKVRVDGCGRGKTEGKNLKYFVDVISV
jgi:hypothetical protein